LCEQLTQTRARLLPLDLRRILLGQSLGLGDELLTVLGRGELRGLRTGGLPGLRGLGIGDESVEGRGEVLEITDDIGLRKSLLQGRGGCSDLTARRPGGELVAQQDRALDELD